MKTIKKAQLGGLIKKGMKAATEAAPKKTMSLAKKVKEAKFQKNKGKFGMEGEDVTLKDFSKKELKKKFGTPTDYTPASKPVVLTPEQKANNARILKEIREGKRKNGGKISKAQGGIRIPKQLEQKGKPDARNSGLAIDTTSVPKGFKKLPGKPISSPDYKPSKRKYKTGGMISKMKNGGSLGMKSVKAGFDNNPGVTRADIITAATKKAKKGMKAKKAKMCSRVISKMAKKNQTGGPKVPKRFSTMKRPGDSMKSTTLTTMKSGGKMKKCRYGCK